jgi:hypothetical protein
MGCGHGLDWFGSGQGKVAGCCECGNELSGSMKSGISLSSCVPVSAGNTRISNEKRKNDDDVGKPKYSVKKKNPVTLP